MNDLEIFGPDQKAIEAASPGVEGPNPSAVVAKGAEAILEYNQIVRFRGRPMILTRGGGFTHYTPLHRDKFDEIGYQQLGAQTRSRMNDIYAFLPNVVTDLTDNEHLILFGTTLEDLEVTAETDLEQVVKQRGKAIVWDTKDLMMRFDVLPPECIWRSPYFKLSDEDTKAVRDKDGRIRFIMQLAGGDKGLYDDIMQSIAPMVMHRKPDGVVWWVGDGANGKSTLMDALYRIFPHQLASITVKRLVDGRDTPSLNGRLANIVKESSEGRVEDTEIYKAIGTHENFRVHKFHSQDDVEIRGNLHHIFSANMIPTFNDKGYAARRRTFIIPFTQRFDSDPLFEERTFTPQLFGALISDMCKYAKQIAEQGYRYKWSSVTRAAKANYDAEASNAEEYVKEVLEQGVVAFDSYSSVSMDYERWCADNGYVKLGVTNLRRALQQVGFERSSKRNSGGSTQNVYKLPAINTTELQTLGMGRMGLYTAIGWVDEAKEIVEKAEAKAEEPKPKQQSILNNKW